MLEVLVLGFDFNTSTLSSVLHTNGSFSVLCIVGFATQNLPTVWTLERCR